jgi:hypothetical protein
MSFLIQRIWMLWAACLVLALQGCASVPHTDARDPWESMNRSVYNFNEVLDNVAIKPAAKVYTAVLPSPVRTGIHNFLGNLGDVWSMVNSALQLKGQATVETFMRTMNDAVTKKAFWQTRWGANPPCDRHQPPKALRVQQFNMPRMSCLPPVMTSAGLLELGCHQGSGLDPYTFVRDGCKSVKTMCTTATRRRILITLNLKHLELNQITSGRALVTVFDKRVAC